MTGTGPTPPTGRSFPLGRAVAGTLIVTVGLLHRMGRSSWCDCGSWFPWAGEVLSAHNSQHLADPYSFTHILHGFLLCGITAFALRRWTVEARLWAAIALEAGWEILENSDFIIHRYRSVTASYGYLGDTVGNSLGDMFSCALGFLIAHRLGLRRAVVVFILTELALAWAIRDSLLINIVMLLHPIDGLRAWQLGH